MVDKDARGLQLGKRVDEFLTEHAKRVPYTWIAVLRIWRFMSGVGLRGRRCR